MAERTGSESPERLLRQALDGDTTAFWELIRRHERMVFAVAVGVTRDGEVAAEVAHDVYLRAFSTLGNLRSAGALGSWLCTMTRNMAHERHRKESRQDKIAQTMPPERIVSVPDLLIAEQELAHMASAMEQLPESHRIVLGLKYMNGMKCQEIAETLGIGVEAAKSRLFEARKALRARMAATARPATTSEPQGRSEQTPRQTSGEK